MPRCYPPTPDFGENRRGERAVWEALRDGLPDDAALFWSVWLLDGGQENEIDLLVAWPGVGLAALEVKGGRVERDDDGRWWQSRGASRRETSHPLVQASDARHSLQRYLQRQGVAAGRGRAQHLLALPHMPVPQEYSPADLPRGQVLDSSELRSAAAVVRQAVETGQGHAPLDAAGLEELVTLLVAQLPGQTSLLAQAEEHEQLVDQLTRDQARTLENFRYHRRLAVIGGAGTGKTWLALEQARRLATLPPPPAPFVGVGTDSKGGVCVYAFTWVPQCFDQVGISAGR